MSDAAAIGSRARVTVVALSCLVVTLLVVAGVVVWSEVRTDPVFDPLHYTNPQTVTSRVGAVSGAPATHLDDPVDVTGEKCADETVGVESVTSWQPVDPRGTVVPAGTGAGVREAGCVVATYQNEIPEAVKAIVRSQHARGIDAPLWIISGAETPTSVDGRRGAVEVWTTEPFAIVAAP